MGVRGGSVDSSRGPTSRDISLNGWTTRPPECRARRTASPTWPRPRRAPPTGSRTLSGMWGWETRANCGAHCNDFQISREFINIAASLKGGPALPAGVAELVKKRTAAQDQDPNVHCMPRGAPRIWTDDYYKRIFRSPDRMIILTERNMQYRQIFTDGRPLPRIRTRPGTATRRRKWDGDTLVVADHRLQRRSVAGCQRQSADQRRLRRPKRSAGRITARSKSKSPSTIPSPTPRPGR